MSAQALLSKVSQKKDDTSDARIVIIDDENNGYKGPFHYVASIHFGLGLVVDERQMAGNGND